MQLNVTLAGKFFFCTGLDESRSRPVVAALNHNATQFDVVSDVQRRPAPDDLKDSLSLFRGLTLDSSHGPENGRVARGRRSPPDSFIRGAKTLPPRSSLNPLRTGKTPGECNGLENSDVADF